jgi:hypothetical protein
VDCGEPTGYSGTSKPSTRCRPCAAKKNGADSIVWTREAIVAAVREWAAQHGEPPATHDWNPYSARNPSKCGASKHAEPESAERSPDPRRSP